MTVQHTDSAKVPVITTVNQGTVAVTGGSVNVTTVNGASSKVEVTGVGATAAVTTVEAGATVEAKTAATASVTVGTVEAMSRPTTALPRPLAPPRRILF